MQHQSERVLFIDDDSPVRNAFVRSLRRHGFDIDVADGAAGALHLLESSQYAVIATDYRMPEVDGLELIEQMRHVQPDATYMLVSGECDLELCLEAVNDHAVSYVIPKPWDTDELATALRRSMETHWEKVTQREMQRSAVNHSRTLDIQKIKLDDALQKSEETFGELLLNALTIRGHETLAHCRRVAAYAEMLAL